MALAAYERTLEAYGVTLVLAASDARLSARVGELMPPGSRPASDVDTGVARFALTHKDGGG